MKKFLLFQIVVTCIELILCAVLWKSGYIFYLPIFVAYTMGFIAMVIIAQGRLKKLAAKRLMNLDYYEKRNPFCLYQIAKINNDDLIKKQAKALMEMYLLYTFLFLFSIVYLAL